MELLIILILILLGIILPIKIFKPTMILLAAVATFIGGSITLPYITSVTGNIFNYATLDTTTTWALGLILLVTSVILYIEMIDTNKKGKEQDD
ncbi:MAG: hypothetical protein WCI04_02460 [archaeon]